jgi:ABC-2 type transport system permease protein
MKDAGIPENASKLRSEMRMFYWFFYRSLVQQLSFRSWFVMRVLGMVISVTTFAIFAQVIPKDEVQMEILARYGIGGEYPMVTWFLLGMLIQNMIALGSAGVSRLVNGRNYPYYHSSPTSLVTVLFGNSSFRYTWVMIEVVAYLIVGSFFGMQIYFNVGFLVVVVTGILLIFSLDLLSAGWNIITKTGEDPLNWFLGLFSQLVSGRLIPVWLLPGWLQAISYIHPQYYINEMARFTLGGNATVQQIWPQLGPLLLLTFIVLVVGYRGFKYGFWKARVEGTLGHAGSRWGRR